MSQAAWTLLGVVVGAMISGGTQVLLDWRRDRSEARKETAKAKAEVKVAVRLIADEVDSLGFEMAQLAERGRSLKTPFSQMPHYLPVDEWKKNKALLAGAVEDETWSELSALYYSADSLRARFASEPPDSSLDEQRIKQLRECVECVEGLRKPLQKASISG